MQDLGNALTQGQDILMLGGGNPAHIPEVQQCFRKSMQRLLDKDDEFERVVGNYDPPQGNKEFIEAICTLLHDEFGWDIEPKNVALTCRKPVSVFHHFQHFCRRL